MTFVARFTDSPPRRPRYLRVRGVACVWTHRLDEATKWDLRPGREHLSRLVGHDQIEAEPMPDRGYFA